MIFCLRQLQEKCIEQDRPLYMVFVDFSQAFDTVGMTGLWQLLRRYGCPEMFTNLKLRERHKDRLMDITLTAER